MIYVYRCEYCGDDIEVKKEMADCNLPETCRKCGSAMMRKYTPIATTWAPNCWDLDKEGLGDKPQLRHKQ